MKIILYFIIMLLLASCSNKVNHVQQPRYKARFEVAGLCSNYTFSVIEGNIDPALIVPEYEDPQTKKKYTNAFGITNPCDLPQGLKQGDEFYFTIDKNNGRQCTVCMAYYPTPAKKLAIKVIP